MAVLAVKGESHVMKCCAPLSGLQLHPKLSENLRLCDTPRKCSVVLRYVAHGESPIPARLRWCHVRLSGGEPVFVRLSAMRAVLFLLDFWLDSQFAIQSGEDGFPEEITRKSCEGSGRPPRLSGPRASVLQLIRCSF